MAKIHVYDKPVDLTKESIGNYYMNLYDQDGVFVEGRHYEQYSGNAMMDEAKELRQCGYVVKW